MSLEDVEKIMAETQDSIEYQQVKEYSTCHIFGMMSYPVGN